MILVQGLKTRIFALFLVTGLLAFFLPDEAVAQQIVFSPDTLYMGKIPTSSLAVREQTAFNISSTSLEITSIAIENDPSASFQILNNPGSASLGITQKVILEIEFQPSVIGLIEADLVFTSNTTNSRTTVPLYGEGLSGSDTYFERVFGPADGGGLSGIVQTASGGYFMTGSTPNLDEEVSDIYMVETDVRGKMTWSGRIEDEDYNESGGRLVPLANNEYLLFGTRSREGSNNTDMQLMKIDADREAVWSETYGGDDIDKAADILVVEGGYLLLGTSDSFPIGGVIGKNVYLVKVNEDGDEQWSATYGGDGGENAKSIIAVSDGGYLILAESTSWASDDQDQDLYLLKVDANGNLIWDEIVDGAGREGAAELAELPGGGFAVVGYSASGGTGGRDMYLTVVDVSGNRVWDRYFGGEYSDGASNVLIAEDGIIIAGSIQVLFIETSDGTDRYSDLFVIKTDFDGNDMWSRQFGGYKNEGASEMLFDTAGNIIISGGTSSYFIHNKVFFLSISPEGEFVTSIDSDGFPRPTDFKLYANYPNPFNNSTVIAYDLFENSHVQINIYNLRGQKIRTLFEADQQMGRHSLSFDAFGLSSGMYLYELQTNRGATAKKLLLLK
jgi:hypothetical protein